MSNAAMCQIPSSRVLHCGYEICVDAAVYFVLVDAASGSVCHGWTLESIVLPKSYGKALHRPCLGNRLAAVVDLGTVQSSTKGLLLLSCEALHCA